MSQLAAKLLPEILEEKLAEITTIFNAQSQLAQTEDQKDDIIEQRNKAIKQLMQYSFQETDRLMNQEYLKTPEVVQLSGCTASVLLVLEDYFVVANCGDSPIIIFRQHNHIFRGEQISMDHKPDQEEERNRILASNGVLEQYESAITGKKIGPMRVWSKHIHQPGLAMSRSLGDGLAKTCGVISTPTVRVI